MIVGLFISSLAYIAAAIIQLEVNRSYPILPSNGHFYASVTNAVPDCNLHIFYDNDQFAMLEYGQSLQNTDGHINTMEFPAGLQQFEFQVKGGSSCKMQDKTITFKDIFDPNQVYFIHVNQNGAFKAVAPMAKSIGGNGEFSLTIVAAFNNIYNQNFVLCRYVADPKGPNPCDPTAQDNFVSFQQVKEEFKKQDVIDEPTYSAWNDNSTDLTLHATVFKAKDLRGGKWFLYTLNETVENVDGHWTPKENIKPMYTGYHFTKYDQGGAHVYVLNSGSTSSASPIVTTFTSVVDNQVNLLWQMPQIVIVTAAEILFSITGLEFAFTQSSPQLKAIVQACWLLSVFFGDLGITLMNINNPFKNEAIEYFVYAGVALIVMAGLAVIAIFFYEYDDYGTEKDEDLKFTEMIKPNLEEVSQLQGPTDSQLDEYTNK